MITIVLNDAPREVASDETIGALLELLALPGRGVAVAVNGEVVRRAEWTSHRLADGDRVEVLTAAQGG